MSGSGRDLKAAQPAAPRRRGGRCCLYGCGFLVILLGAVVVAGWLGYQRYGAPWLEAKKAQLVARFPALDSLLALRRSLDLEGLTLTGGEMGSRDPADFPGDVWRPRDPSEATFNVTPQGALAAFTLPAGDPASLAATARSEMIELGWRRVPVADPHDGVSLLFEGKERTVSYGFYALDEGLEIWIQVRRKAPSPSRQGP